VDFADHQELEIRNPKIKDFCEFLNKSAVVNWGTSD
jgi:hypothetical protein